VLEFKTPSVVSLFTGAGGLDAGLESAGLSTTAAVECDSDCVATLRATQARRVAVPSSSGATRAYLQHTTILQRRIEDVSAADLRPARADRSWTPDVLAGGPPCQPFSSAGKQLSVSDPRGRLFEEFVRLASELRPKYILFENVRGLVTAKGPAGEAGEVLSMVKETFERAGYATSFKLLNSADYGAPQRRVRLFMMGARVSPLPQFPLRTHAATPQESLFPCLPWVTLGQFLATHRFQVDEADVIVPSPSLEAALASVAPGSGLKSPGARETTRPGGHWGYKQGTFVADPSLPARTVTASSTQDWMRRPDGSLRRLTWRECAGLQGFPSEWQFVGDRASKYRQIGNAVPSVFGAVLGRALLDALSTAGHRGRPVSAEFPLEIKSSIDYTKRENARNGESRARVRTAIQNGSQVSRLKGLGSADKVNVIG
jgi:DNA (cytosine-5)-methyltransferase 1